MGSPDSERRRTFVTTALAPCLWGTTYIVFTQTLPVGHPLLIAFFRAVPAGLLLMLVGAGLPPRNRVIPLTMLGLANIGCFFGFLFIGAARLPGGVAATLGSVQPLIVAFLAWPLLHRRPRAGQIAAALLGLFGVALLALDSRAGFDPVGLFAALAGAASMAVGTVLIERWGRMGTPLQLTAWQLTLGGLVLLPLSLMLEGVPPTPTLTNVAGMTYLVLIGTALAYWIWVRGIMRVGADAGLLVLFSPVVATLLGTAVLREWLGPVQWIGVACVLLATLAGIWFSRRRTLEPTPAVGTRSPSASTP